MNRTKYRCIIAGVLSLVIGIFLVIALLSIGWYYFSADLSVVGEKEENYGLDEVEGKFVDESGSVDIERKDISEIQPREPIDSVVGVVKILLIIGIIFTLIFSASCFVAGFSLIPLLLPKIIAILAAIFIIFGPIYMLLQLPHAWDETGIREDYEFLGFHNGPYETFSGSSAAEDDELGKSVTAWGPGWCWFGVLGAGVLMLFIEVLFYGLKGGSKKEEDRLQILKERLVRGEITKEEFEDMRLMIKD